jgi:TctA family transporter
VLLGVVIGSIAGPIPGVGGPLTLVLLMPFALSMDSPFSAFALLLSAHGVMNTGNSITAILFGVPGTSSAQALVVDGYPLARKGEAGRAFGASFVSSGVGGVFGAICLVAAIPVVTPLVKVFGSPELFMLAIWGLSMVGMLSGRFVIKGLAMGAFGLLLSTVGLDPQRAIPRYTFGDAYFWDGLPLIAIALGLFAAPEAIDIIKRKNLFPEEVTKASVNVADVMRGVRDVLRNWTLLLRTSALGVWLGIIPGIGGSVIDWLAYGHTVQSSRDRDGFGHGDIRGVIGPDAATNSKEGGTLIPTIAFGVPGGVGMAILLGAFTGLGLTPGREMLTEKLDITFGLIWIIALSNLIAAAALLSLAHHLARVTKIRASLLGAIIMTFTILGAFMARRHPFDLVMLLVFSLVGYIMKLYDWPRPPVILGFVLGDILERYLFISFRTFGVSWFWRPGVVAILVLIVGSFVAVPSRKPSGRGLPRTEETSS